MDNTILKSEYPFEAYLKEVCFRENPSVLDDDMSDFFDNWITELDGEEFVKHGNVLAKTLINVFVKNES